MVDPDKPEKEKESFFKKIKEDEHLKKGVGFFWDRRIEFISGALMLIGIVLSFFYTHIGGTLVGLGFGICFFEEIHSHFLQFRGFYSEQGLFKTLMLIAIILYFLISIPAFIIATAIGFGAIYLIRLSWKNR